MIGESHYRLGGERHVKGSGQFTDDVKVPRMLHAVVLRSPHAHARLVSIDAKRALDMTGVHAVLTANDVPASATIPNRLAPPQGDADAALTGAHVVVGDTFHYPRQTAAALETRGLVAVPPDPRGGELHLIGSTKCIHINRTILAKIFDIPVGALRLTEVDVGGGFGLR